MKIGVMLRHINELGGVVVYTKSIIKNLLSIDNTNEYIFIYNDHSLLGSYSEHANVKEVVIDIRNKLLWDQVGVPQVVKREKIDVIFNPKLSIPLFAKCKKIFTLHGLEQFALPNVFEWYDHMYFRFMTPLYCRRAHAIIVMTDTGKHDLKRYLDVKNDKIEVICESCNEKFKLPKDDRESRRIRKKYSLPHDYIFFIGGITPLKNFSNIVKAYNIIKDRVSVKLVIAGFKRWKFSRDIDLIRQLKLQDHVINLGYIDDEDLPYLYNCAKCLVFPSLYEGFGIPILEAQASGCPVITSKTGCTPEVSGGAATLVNPYNYREIAQAIFNILNDNNLREKLISDGFENVKKFNWHRTAENTLNLFKRLA